MGTVEASAERAFAPRAMRRSYLDELGRLNAYVSARQPS
jgi:hypothetical protein